MRDDRRARTFRDVKSGGGDLFIFMGLTLMIVIFVNTTAGYLPASVSGPSFIALGRRLFWVTLLLSIYISASYSYRIGLLVVAGACSMLFFRLLSLISPTTPFFLSSYQLSYSVVIALAAAVIYKQAGGLYDKFVRTIIYLSAPVLLLQLLGVSEIVHSWNTLAGPRGVQDLQLSSTFMVEASELRVYLGQLRPPGLFYTNSVSAVFAVFAIALRMGQRITRPTFYDLLLISVALLMGAKLTIVFLVLAIALKYFRARDRLEVRAMRYMVLVVGILFFLYSLIFPGVFSTVLNRGLLLQSSMIRVADVLATVGVDFTGFLTGLFGDTGQLLGLGFAQVDAVLGADSGRVAGSFSDIRILILLTPLLMWLWVRIRRAKKNAVMVEHVIRSEFLIAALVATFLASPFLGTPLVALLFGPALAPLLQAKVA